MIKTSGVRFDRQLISFILNLQGQFISEYVGDLIDQEEASRRLEESHRRNITNFYMMTLDDCRFFLQKFLRFLTVLEAMP